MNYIKTVALLGVLTALFIFIGDMIGGRQGAIVGLGFAGVMNFVSYWFSDKIVLAMYRAKEVTEAEVPQLFTTVRSLATRANMPMPRVYIMEMDTPNAFATGRNPSHGVVAVTTGIMKLLTRDELEGVLAHELAHIKNRDILISTIAATFAGAISYLAQMAMFASMFSGSRDNERDSNPLVLIVMMIVAPLAAMVIQMAISRSREYGADAGGAQISGNPMNLANALRKLEYYNKKMPITPTGPHEATSHLFIVNPLSGGGLVKLFSTHPPIEERIKKLETLAGYRYQNA